MEKTCENCAKSETCKKFIGIVWGFCEADFERKMKYIVKVWSNSTHEREYETDSRSAMKAAEKFGRHEGGEVVQVCNKSGKVLSEVRWTPEEGGHYYRALSDDDYERLGKW